MYTHIYVAYEVTGINHGIRSTVHIFDILLNKYSYNITNTVHTAYMLYGHINLTFLAQLCYTNHSFVVLVVTNVKNLAGKLQRESIQHRDGLRYNMHIDFRQICQTHKHIYMYVCVCMFTHTYGQKHIYMHKNI